MVQAKSLQNVGSAVASSGEVLISADSHVTERFSVWEGLLDSQFWEEVGAKGLKTTQGTDPVIRLSEMSVDGVLAEVLYPTLALSLFGIEDVELHEACCRVYNRWLVEYCSADPERLLGIALIPCYRTEVAIEELRTCHAAGMRGAMVWQTPHPDLPFTSLHYDPIWQAAEELSMPINVHILSGFNYSRRVPGAEKVVIDERLRQINHYYNSVNEKIACTSDTLFSFVFGGVFERFPNLRLVIVENEVSWAPFFLDQWDYYYRRFLGVHPLEITKPPSEYFNNQVYLTFFRDPWVGRMLPSWGRNNLMWSNDFPHPNSTWPHSREYVANQLEGVDSRIKDRVLRQNCLELYNLSAELIPAASETNM